MKWGSGSGVLNSGSKDIFFFLMIVMLYWILNSIIILISYKQGETQDFKLEGTGV